jgi:hypothetical protein
MYQEQVEGPRRRREAASREREEVDRAAKEALVARLRAAVPSVSRVFRDGIGLFKSDAPSIVEVESAWLVLTACAEAEPRYVISTVRIHAEIMLKDLRPLHDLGIEAVRSHATPEASEWRSRWRDAKFGVQYCLEQMEKDAKVTE